jgi:hypothetical protein
VSAVPCIFFRSEKKQRNVAAKFHILKENRALSPFLSLQDLGRLSGTCRRFVSFRDQMDVQVVEGKACPTLKRLRKFLGNTKREHVFARVYAEEITGIGDVLCASTTRTLLLQPAPWDPLGLGLGLWNPYAIVREVAWLAQFERLEHLEIAVGGPSARAFVALLRAQLPNLGALVVSSNGGVCDGFWAAVAAMPRPKLRCLCVQGFLLESPSLVNVRHLRYLWIHRPGRTWGVHHFLARVALDIPGLVYLTTRDFVGLRHHREVERWMRHLQGDALPSLRFWETDGCGIAHVDVLTLALASRRPALTIQGVTAIRDEQLRVGPHHITNETHRRIPLQEARTYRKLDVLEKVVVVRLIN